MEKRVLIGTVEIERDVVMWNNQFGYAASFEQLTVPKGVYPVYAFTGDLARDKNGKVSLGWRNYIGYEGTIISGNVGGKPGDHTDYHLMIYDYSLAEYFLEGYSYYDKTVRMTYELRPEWGIELHDFVSSFDNKRIFTKSIFLKDGAELPYME